MKNLLKIFAVMLFAAMASFFIACSEDCPTCPAAPTFSPTGSWKGILEMGGTINLTLNSSVTGNGFISAGSLNVSCQVPNGTCSGSSVGSTISFTITIEGYESINYQGTVKSVTVHSGTLNGSGFAGDGITFTKQ